MKRLFLWLINIIVLAGCTAAEDINSFEYMTQKLYLTQGNQTVSATMYDNVATQALVATLQKADITYDAHDYGGFEKVGALGITLPTDDHQTTTTIGDIVLYNSNQIVIFYGSNSWSYTRIGKIDNATVESIKNFLRAGEGNVKITLSVNNTTTDIQTNKNSQTPGQACSILGQPVSAEYKGVVIEDGKKHLRK